MKSGKRANIRIMTVMPLMMIETLERAPQFALSVMRAIAPQMGMPPARPATRLDKPVPRISRFESNSVFVCASRIFAANCVSRIAMIATENEATTIPPQSSVDASVPPTDPKTLSLSVPIRYG